MRRRRLLVVAVVAAVLTTAGITLFLSRRPAPPPAAAVPRLPVTDPSFAATVQAHARSPVVSGNAVDLLVNGDQFFPAKLAVIRSARRTLTYAEYFYAEGRIAAEVAQAIAERCRAGVDAKILLDAVGTMSMDKDDLTTLRVAGCHVTTFHPLGRLAVTHANHRNHRRVLVADGRVAITGGSGVSWKWTGDGRTPEHWRDTDVRLEGPVVAQVQAAFVENWREATGELLGGPDYFPPLATAGTVSAAIVTSSPTAGSGAMSSMFLLAVAGARRSILVTNPYFLPDEDLTRQFVAAARRGVHVAVLVPGVIDHQLVREASRRHFGALFQAGVELYEYGAALLHSKTMVIDGAWATVGSTNIDHRSFALNDELNVAVYDARFARELERVFAHDLQVATRLTYERWRHRGLKARLYEIFAAPFEELF